MNRFQDARPAPAFKVGDCVKYRLDLHQVTNIRWNMSRWFYEIQTLCGQWGTSTTEPHLIKAERPAFKPTWDPADYEKAEEVKPKPNLKILSILAVGAMLSSCSMQGYKPEEMHKAFKSMNEVQHKTKIYTWTGGQINRF